MAAAHIFVLPCVTAADGDQEGVPVVLMEAQAAGVPVISTWHAGVPEVVRDGMSGYLVPERDIDALVLALQRLIERHEQWPTMGLEGRAHMIAEFDVNQAAADVERLYDRVVERH
jgi:colanic acid/amylovoran biosynthesis glycosyltransferase